MKEAWSSGKKLDLKVPVFLVLSYRIKKVLEPSTTKVQRSIGATEAI